MIKKVSEEVTYEIDTAKDDLDAFIEKMVAKGYQFQNVYTHGMITTYKKVTFVKWFGVYK